MAWKGNRLGVAFTDGSIRVWEITISAGDPKIKSVFLLGPDILCLGLRTVGPHLIRDFDCL
jgi:hypothetical protein